MTVEELIKKLQQFDGKLPVFCEPNDEWLNEHINLSLELIPESVSSETEFVMIGFRAETIY